MFKSKNQFLYLQYERKRFNCANKMLILEKGKKLLSKILTFLLFCTKLEILKETITNN